MTGDVEAIHMAMRLWTGQRDIQRWIKSGNAIALHDRHRKRNLTFAPIDRLEQLKWPGGKLVWMFAETGPGRPELDALSRTVARLGKTTSEVLAVICIPTGTNLEQFSQELAAMETDLRWAVPTETDLNSSVIVVELSTGGPGSLNQFLQDL